MGRAECAWFAKQWIRRRLSRRCHCRGRVEVGSRLPGQSRWNSSPTRYSASSSSSSAAAAAASEGGSRRLSPGSRGTGRRRRRRRTRFRLTRGQKPNPSGDSERWGGLKVSVGKTKLGDSTPNHPHPYPHPLYASHHRQAKREGDEKTVEVVVGTWAHLLFVDVDAGIFDGSRGT